MIIEEILETYNYDGKLKSYCERFGLDAIAREVSSTQTYSKDQRRFWETLTVARDLAISSDLTEGDRNAYLSLLTEYNFFRNLEPFLYHDRLSIKSATIFTFGKFSISENSPLLERAFKESYYLQNPILAARCLGEISWLEQSTPVRLMENLVRENDILNFMTRGLVLSSSGNTETEMRHLIDEYQDNIEAIKDLGTSEDPNSFFWTFELFVTNIHHTCDLSDWNREKYKFGIEYYLKNRRRIFLGNGTRPDYEAVYNDMMPGTG
jgi:hypothetical protein